MPDLSWSHILLVVIVALVVVGPKDLPRLMRTVGQWTGKARQMADQLRKSFDDMTKQAELDELRNELEALRSRRPFYDADRELSTAIIPSELQGAVAQPEVGGPETGDAGNTPERSQR
ncbi:MAG: twin-arginine translocase subunit TatB [Alphaproteobacteria bacterium]|nr:twin-arginine translocase subunit TatB [Alphaproteobacteria bacterium]